MSQRWLHTEKYDFLAGWDRPLQHFFITVYAAGGPGTDGEDVLLYDNLADPLLRNGGTDLRGVERKIKEFGVIPPLDFLVRLEKDKADDAGWNTVSHSGAHR